METLPPPKVNAETRFKATVWAQIAGFSILVALLLVFGIRNRDLLNPGPDYRELVAGLSYIQMMIGAYLVGTTITGAIPFLIAWIGGGQPYTQRNADIAIWTFVGIDICVLLFLVCQERGLCRSMFLPVFLLIPIVYVAVERPDKRSRTLLVLGIIMSAMIVSYTFSDQRRFSFLMLLVTYVLYGVMVLLFFLVIERSTSIRRDIGIAAVSFILILASVSPYLLLLLWNKLNLWDVKRIRGLNVVTTDFHVISHGRFDAAILIVSVLSILIPIVQNLALLYQSRKVTQREDPATKVQPSEGGQTASA